MESRVLMKTRANRRRVIAATVASTATISLSQTGTAERTAPPTFTSGGLGLTRPEFEARFGTGEPVETAGDPRYDSTYAYGTQLGTIFVWYHDLGDDSFVTYIEIDVASETLSSDEARNRAERLLPTDSQFTELYVAPATPNGPVAIEMMRFVSPSLGEVHDRAFPSEIVVMIHQLWADASSDQGPTASRISIMTRLATIGGAGKVSEL